MPAHRRGEVEAADGTSPDLSGFKDRGAAGVGLPPLFHSDLGMPKRTPLYDRHVAAGAQIVPFGGWDMPLHYGSQIAEHHAVRRHAGVFDVSHMTVVDISGAGASGLPAQAARERCRAARAGTGTL